MSENSKPLTMDTVTFRATLVDEAGRELLFYVSLISEGLWIGPQHDSNAPSAFIRWPQLYAAAAKQEPR